jgi:putative transcriptional regulator
MNIHSGTLLISTPALDNTNFEKAIVFIAEYNQQGAMGFVINNLFPRTLNDLVEFNYSKPFPLFDGGPVEREGLFFLHQRPGIIEGGTAIINAVCMGGNFKQAVAYINDTRIQQNEIKLFIGYCGWDAGELEEEITEGSWLIIDAAIETVFYSNTEKLWEKLYKEKIR